MGFPGGSGVKNLPANAGDADASSIPGSGRSPGEGNGNPVKCSWNIGKLENPTDRGPCWATVHGSQKRHDLGIKQRLYKYHFLYFSR